MLLEADLQEYLDEIRKTVCARCVERPPGGPPCHPLHKECGIEMHLPELIESVHQVRSSRIAPYLERNRREICDRCAFQHSSYCACPMDYLLVLIVEAVETVDQRRRERGEMPPPAAVDEGARGNLAAFRQAFKASKGTWTGCDWATNFGKAGLDLNGWTAAAARGEAERNIGAPIANDWMAAVNWLAQIEDRARQAEAKANAALTAAQRGHWQEATQLAEWAWALEFSTGRPLHRPGPPAWQALCEQAEAAQKTTA